jgi:tRNA (cytidine/uridine-2'-O-)-methyltransferase
MSAHLHIVLYQPQIPPNTGNIARLCACTHCQLHLVHPLGFHLDDRQLRRAGLDYWPYLDVREHAGWQEVRTFLADHRRWFALSTKGKSSLWEVKFRLGDVLVFGSEISGLPSGIMDEITGIRIPLRGDAPVRSLNLSTAAGIAVYEALRQCRPVDFR